MKSGDDEIDEGSSGSEEGWSNEEDDHCPAGSTLSRVSGKHLHDAERVAFMVGSEEEDADADDEAEIGAALASVEALQETRAAMFAALSNGGVIGVERARS